jgi:hypothetical protein
VGDVCERYELEFLRMPGLVSCVHASQRGMMMNLPLGRSGCELGEWSWGECAVIVVVWVMVVGQQVCVKRRDVFVRK